MLGMDRMLGMNRMAGMNRMLEASKFNVAAFESILHCERKTVDAGRLLLSPAATLRKY